MTLRSITTTVSAMYCSSSFTIILPGTSCIRTHATNYWGSKETGEFLSGVMATGATVDWREHIRKSIGADMSAKPMVDYFGPLMEYLQRVNAGRTCTLPESI